MAFGKKYFSSYKSNNNLDYYLELWVENFDSSATEISVGAGGPVISYETDQEDRFSPILSSQCVLPFVVKNTSLQAFIQQLRTTYKERQVYLHLYRATSSTYTTTKPIWSGFLVMDLGSGEDVSFPYEQKLTFVDGLSLLKDIDFVDLSDTSTPPGDTIPLNERIQGNYDRLNMYYGPAVYTFWIKEILAKAGIAISGVDGQGVSIDYGFTTAVNWYNADMQNTNQGSDPLGLTQCVVSMFHNKNDQDVFTPENCYTVLKELLRHWGARITYWKHEFWIVQIPEYIQDESGLIDNPDNINSRQYNRFGTLTGSQDHLGDTYYTRYEQTIQSNQVSKLVGTKYNYLPMIHNAEADFLSFASKNYYGGFPYGVNAESQEIFQGTIIDPSTANFLWLSVPLNWTWDMTGSSLTAGHENGWWCSVKFNFYASDGTTTYYLQYDSSGQGSYYWVLEADWNPLGNTSPKYIIKSRSLTETNYIGFQENIPFVDSSGSAITMTGAWSFFLDIEDFANQSSSGNNGSFYCRFSGYAPSSHYSYVKKDPYQEFPYLPTTSDVSGGGPQTKSGTVRWSNTLENPSGVTTTSFSTPAGFDAGTSQADIQLITTSPFKGLLQTLNTTQTSSFGLSLNTQVNNSTNTEKFSFGTLLWGDAIQQFAVGCLRVNNGTAFVKTNPDGEWGRGTLTGTNTFTELLIDEFLSGQIKVVIAPTMRLAVGEENKNQTATGTSGPATRPRYVNPIGRLREFRSNETDPEYIFRRGSFHSLYDEWDYEGYQILRDTVSSTTTTTDIGDLGGTQDNKPISNAKMIGNVNNALMMNSPVAYLRTTVPATGSNVAVNGNFNTAVGWTLGTGWSIDTTAKKAKFAATGSTSELTQSVLTQGLTYQVNFQVVVTAGTLLVKAGTSGTSQSITTSGDYSLYLDCDGSNLIKFQAGTTFTGNITYITLRDQKSISAVPINSIGSTVFKSGDTFNLINSLGGEILPLTVSSNQGATDDTISVTSTALFDDIGIDSVLLINQDDLSAQYQNKTKGTVAGFGIDADGISKGGIEITGWLNSDTMSGAAVTNVPTALSVKNYVDGQVGASDTLQEVTNNGNTTTNSVMIGSSDAPLSTLHLKDGNVISSAYNNASLIIEGFSKSVFQMASYNTGFCQIAFGDQNDGFDGGILYSNASRYMSFEAANAEKMRLTSGGNVLINTTTDVSGVKLQVNGNTRFGDSTTGISFGISSTDVYQISGVDTGFSGWNSLHFKSDGNDGLFIQKDTNNIGINELNPTEKLHVVGKGIFTDQLTIPAIPVASTDAASKGYVDAQVSATDSLQEVTTVGNTTTNSIMIGSSSSPSQLLHIDNPTGASSILLEGAGGWYSQILFRTNPSSGQGWLAYDYSGNVMTFGVSGSEKMRLTSGGNLGIGVSNPLTKVHINDGTNINLKIGESSGEIQIKTTNDADTAFTPLIIRANKYSILNGNVGIGTTSPSGKLHITNGTNAINTGANADRWAFTGATFNYIQSAGQILIQPVGDLVLNSAGSETMRLKNTNVLIGTTTNSGGKLNIKGNLFFQQDSYSDNTTIGFGNPARNGDAAFITYDGNGDFRGSILFGTVTTASNVAASEVMRISKSGNLLIGTTTDSGEKLVVNGNAKYSGKILAGVGATAAATINAYTTTVSTNLFSALRILENTGASSYWDIGATGGTSTLLNFYHNANTTAKISFTHLGGATFSGTVTADTYFQSSDTSAVLATASAGSVILRPNGAGSGTGALTVGLSNTTISNVLRAEGNVLIGTTTDSGQKLQVNGDIKIGDSNHLLIGSSSDLDLYHTGTNSFVENWTGDLYIRNNSNGNDVIFQCDDVSGGVETYFFLDGSIGLTTFPDNKKLAFGTGNDLQIKHTGTHSYITQAGTGNLYISNTRDGKDIILQSDNGTGGTADYITLDGSQTTINLQQSVLIGTTTNSGVYKLDVFGKARVQSVFELDDVLTLNQISTPADPQSGQSSIYMDSADGAIKCKINVGGTVVTRTIASFE